MAYLALYRKYRPQSFEDIMGQEHVTRTLQNAIRQNRVAHALLFCGPRGTAKTTTARVLAKAMNCEHGPTPEPCDHCDACVRIREGRSLDVVEIDAASNRGIDDIKLLREQVGRASAQERFKFYIIDEVHQLSADAFQALLKTLEEPPPNVIFVLATTETHRVPKTIISRCQRFDFRRGTMKDLTDSLKRVTQAEGLPADPEALSAIARAAAGGWRDALSLLEQISAYSPERIDLDAVHTVLGSVEESALFRLTDALAAQDTSVLFREIETLIGEGKEPRQLLSALGTHLRDLLWTQSGAGDAAQLAPEAAGRYREQAGQIPAGLLMAALDAINKAESQMRSVSDHRLLLELTLLRIASGTPQGNGVSAPPATQEKPKTAAATPVKRSAPTPSAPLPEESASLPEDRGASEPVPVQKRETPTPPPSEPKREATPSTPEEYATADDSIEGGLEDLWHQVLQKVRPNLRGLLKDGTPLGISGKIYRVGFRYKAHADLLNQKDNKAQIDKILKALSGLDLQVKGEESKNASPKAPAVREGTDPAETEFLTDTEFAKLFGAQKISEGDS